jgi:hypothetical protein
MEVVILSRVSAISTEKAATFRYNVLANTFEVPVENNAWPPIRLFTAWSR